MILFVFFLCRRWRLKRRNLVGLILGNCLVQRAVPLSLVFFCFPFVQTPDAAEPLANCLPSLACRDNVVGCMRGPSLSRFFSLFFFLYLLTSILSRTRCQSPLPSCGCWDFPGGQLGVLAFLPSRHGQLTQYRPFFWWVTFLRCLSIQDNPYRRSLQSCWAFFFSFRPIR